MSIKTALPVAGYGKIPASKGFATYRRKGRFFNEEDTRNARAWR